MLDQIFEGFEWTEVSRTARLFRIKMICEDREDVKPQFELRLTELNIDYEWRPHSPDSSWGDFQFKLAKQTIRVFFKNQKQDACTAYFEGAQCIFLAALQTNPRLDLSLENVKECARTWAVMDAVNIDRPLNHCLTKLPISWAESSEKTARHILKKLRRTDYTFNRCCYVTKMIDDTFYRLNRGAFTQIDKWNPYDIALVSKPQLASLRNDLDQLNTLDEYNNWLRRRLEDNHIVLISLKKVKKDPKMYSINTPEYWEKNHDEAKFVTVRINTGKKDFTSSNNCQVDFIKYGKEFTGTFRPSSPGAAVNCEIKQKSSDTQDGKVGLVSISRCFRDVGFGFDVTDAKWHNQQSRQRSPVLIDRVWEKASRLDDPKITREDYCEKVKKLDDNWLYSMDVGTNIIAGINALATDQRDKWCELLYKNGAAQREDCGPYLKVMERLS